MRPQDPAVPRDEEAWGQGDTSPTEIFFFEAIRNPQWEGRVEGVGGKFAKRNLQWAR